MNLRDLDRSRDRGWVDEAVRRIEADAQRSADTHLLALPIEGCVDLYLKDESSHPTGSLKHRLARSLVLFGLVNGWIVEGTTLVEASSGSTAVSEAYFARLLGLPFIAVLPRTTSPEKIALIERTGGSVEYVDDPGTVYAVAAAVADRTGGHFLDQFTYAERATDWRGNNTIATSIFEQLQEEPHPIPAWIVVGAGTGGTSSTLGRYVRYRRLATRICVVDPEGSAFFGGWESGSPAATGRGSRIEGIGRPRMEPSFLPGVVDRMIGVPDSASIAAMRWLRDIHGLVAGPSTGTNLIGALHVARELAAAGVPGSVVTLLCDRGERYAGTCYDDGWVAAQGWDLAPWTEWITLR